MVRSIVLLIMLFHTCSADITTKVATRTCDVLKMTCDALPYRSVHFESNCYFTVDVLAKSDETAKQCSTVLPGSKLAAGTPEAVWTALLADKNEFLLEGNSSAIKTKAMCRYEHAIAQAGFVAGSVSLCVRDSAVSKEREGTCSALARTKQAPQEKFWARIPVWPGAPYVPLVVEFPSKIEPGQELVFRGLSRPGSNEFAINLLSDSNKFLQLHILIVFSTKLVRMNSWGSGGWGVEEHAPHDLQISQPFQVTIRTTETHFKICIDGKDLIDYKYRQSLASTTHFQIVSNFGFLLSYQLGKTLNSYPLVTAAGDIFPICKRDSPDAVCKSLVVSGATKKGYYRSVINLYRKNGDVALHINFCYDRPAYLTIATLNEATSVYTWTNNIKVSNPYPKPGEHMEVEIVNEEGGFQIFVNGEKWFFFTHLMPSHDIGGVEVSNFLEPLVTFRDAQQQKFFSRIVVWPAAPYAPLEVELPAKIEAGQEMIFKCQSISASNEFKLQLQSAGYNIQLQVHILFAQRLVYLNSFVNNQPGKAETVSHSLTVNKPFEISIRAAEDHFKIGFDGKVLAEYKYRQPLASTTHFQVLSNFGYLISYKLGGKSSPFPLLTATDDTFPICTQADAKACKTLVVSGTVKKGFYRSVINLYRRNGDVALHTNFCYDRQPYLTTAVQTGWNDAWTWINREVPTQPFPGPGEHMEVAFVNGEKEFQITVNGKFFANYTHRMPSFDIAGVEVTNIIEPIITLK